MALSTRDLYLVLRARDEASRVVRGLSSELLRAGAAARAASARSQAAMLRQQAMQARANGASAAQLAALAASAAAWDREAQRIQQAAAARQRFGSIVQQTSQAMITGGVVMAASGALTIAWLASTVKAAVEYERQVRLTMTQVSEFSTSIKEIGDIGLRVAQNVGVAFESLQPALFDIFSSTNANIKQAELLLTSFARAAVAGQVSIQDASRATISIMNAFNIPFEKVNEVLDVQFQLVKFGVGTYEEFSKHLGNVIPSAARAGQTFETVAAMLALMTRNGLSVAMASTSAARALEAMSHPKTIERMEKMGIKVKDAAGNMLPLTDILRDLRSQIDKLPPTDRVKALVELFKGAGGTIQARRFLEQVLLRPGELEELEFFLKQMEGSSGAFESAYNTMADSVAVKTELLKNKWKVLKETIGAAVIPSFIVLIDAISNVLDKFNSLSPSTKKMIADFLLWGSVAAIVVGAILVIIGGLAGLAAALVVGGEALGFMMIVLTGFGTIIMGFATFLIMAWQNSETLRNGLGALGQSLQDLWNTAREVLGPLAEDIRNTFGQDVMEGIRTAGDVLGGFITAIAGIIQGYLIPALRDAKGWWDANQATIRPLLEVFGQVVKWIIIIGASVLGLIALIGVGGLVGAFMMLMAGVKMTVAVLSFFWQGTMLVVNAIKSFIQWLSSAIQSLGNFGNQARAVMMGIPSMIMGVFAAAGSWLVNAGARIIGGLIDGVRGKIGELKGVLGSITSMIPDWKGPKQHDLKLLVPTGKFIMMGLAQGIRDGASLVQDTLGSITGQIGTGQAMGPPSVGNVEKTYQNTFNISTQEIDPRKHAAMLGFELQAVMP